MVEFVSKLSKPVEKKDIRTKGRKRRQKKVSTKPRAPLATVRKTPVVRLNPKSSPFQPLGNFRPLQQIQQPNIPPQFHNRPYLQNASMDNQADQQHLKTNMPTQMHTRLYHGYPIMNNQQARTPMPTLVDHPYSSYNSHSSQTLSKSSLKRPSTFGGISCQGASFEKGLMKLTRPQSLIAHNKKVEVNLLQYGQEQPAGYRSFSWMQPHTRGKYLTRAERVSKAKSFKGANSKCFTPSFPSTTFYQYQNGLLNV